MWLKHKGVGLSALRTSREEQQTESRWVCSSVCRLVLSYEGPISQLTAFLDRRQRETSCLDGVIGTPETSRAEQFPSTMRLEPRHSVSALRVTGYFFRPPHQCIQMTASFLVHQALALCNDFDSKRISLDTLIRINKGKLDPNTWSPMLKEHSEPEFSLPIRKLLNYTLIQSDNNVSNLMFKRLLDIAKTDSFVATIIPRSSFQIAYTEEEMSADHDKAYSNYTSPLGAAMLMNRLFTDKIISDEKQDFIKNTLKECKTGKDRIAAPLLDKEGVVIAHKTGSGYINENGILAAHNDVAFIRLPNNEYYTLAVFVKDFKGNETQAAKVIARISETVYSLLPQFTE